MRLSSLTVPMRWIAIAWIALTAFFPLPALSQEPAAPAASDAPAPEAPRPTERPFLWRIDGETPSYLYGTIHLPDDRVLALPDVVREAIESSDGLYTEIPMELSEQLKAASKIMLPGMTTLSDKLPEDLHDRLATHLESKGLQVMMFSKFFIRMEVAEKS
jgi:uncharacterized protein YbaP (TraB family)